MRIHVSLNDEDYIAFNIYHYFHSRSNKNSILLGRLSCLIISASALLTLIILGVDQKFLTAWIVLLTVYSIFCFLYYPKSVKRNIRKNIMKMKVEGKLDYDAEATIEFAENEIVETSLNRMTKVPYSEILDVLETEEYIYIKFGAQTAFIIPIRCLDNKDAILELLRQKRVERG